MFYAKSNPEESIYEHTKNLLENLKILKKLYGEEISKDINLDNDRFWYLLEIICTYHDLGKIYTPFQNKILEKLNKPQIPTNLSYEYIKHEQLSPMFIPVEEYHLTKEEQMLVFQAIYYHHERIKSEVENELVSKIIQEDILHNIDKIKKEIPIKIADKLSLRYLTKVGNRRRINESSDLYKEYCLLKGLLHRLDHSSSAGIQIEDDTTEKLINYTEKFLANKGATKRNLQVYAMENKNENLLVIGSTGMGKTEAALLWSNYQKTFFTLPIRISINAIYDRIKDDIGYKHVGILHSSALEYIEGKQEFENQYINYEQTKNLYEKVTTCTIDQIFTFVFKYKGYEKIYSTLSYSKIIIDEIQAYSPEIVAVILKGLQMINSIGGNFMIMTATLPRIYKEELEKMNVKFKYNEFISPLQRHKIKLENKCINEDVEEIIEQAKNKKVLIIVNTVDKAIQMYKELKSKEKVKNINLLHSRFIIKDRNEKEEKIKKFSSSKNEKGIWITTQLVEASLDIDFDMLYTEMSTLDSLFQRLGRCYRTREYEGDVPNIHIYTQYVTGIGLKSVYDEEIHNNSIKLLENYDNQILQERAKVELVDKLYSRDMLKETKFLKNFEQGINILNNIIDYETSKSDAQKLLRNIESVTVIPKTIYDDNILLFEQYNKAKQYKDKNKIRREINKLTTNISKSQANRQKQYITKIPYIDNNEILCIDLEYSKEIGLQLNKSKEEDVDSRTM